MTRSHQFSTSAMPIRQIAASYFLLTACACGARNDAQFPNDRGRAEMSAFARDVSFHSGFGSANASVVVRRLAFPGAEGYGAATVGGLGGQIVQITNLADSGPGSFRACVDMLVPRVCVFRVSGVIRFTQRPPVIKSPYLTIAGETAPGDGITLTHSGGAVGFTPFVIKNTHDVIVRHIRSRPDRIGDVRGSNDAFTIEHSQNIIIDHVSGSWALDENINGHAQVEAMTISWSIFAEGIPPHDKCALLSSDPTGPQRMSFISNLCAHNGDRNPDANFYPGSCVEIINNIFYNAQSQFTEIWESYGGSPVSIVGNYYRSGPNTNNSATGIDRESIGATGRARIFQSGNQFDGKFVYIEPNVPEVLVAAPLCPLTISPISAPAAYTAVLQKAGSFPRDAVDNRLVQEVQTRSGRIVYAPGIIPQARTGAPYRDTDADGMSDDWETAHGTNWAAKDSWGDRNGDGIPNLVAFLDEAHRLRLSGLYIR